MTSRFEVRVEWLDAPGVKTAELAATWARFEFWVAGTCVTQVESEDGTFRRSIFGSLYPLAEWIASNWWLLNSHVRPSGIDMRYWVWRNVSEHPWLWQHNFRSAGDGMSWPDLTIVPEGSVTQFVWAQDRQTLKGPIRFASSGSAVLPSVHATEALAEIVNIVIDRLADMGVAKTRLIEEWAAVAGADDEERDFCESVARLGIDPYAVEDSTAEDVLSIASSLPSELLPEFFDSADVASLREAADWTVRSLRAADRVASKAAKDLSSLREVVAPVLIGASTNRKPWATGYDMARRVRSEFGISNSEAFNSSPWVGAEMRSGSRGIPGVVAVKAARCGLILGGSGSSASTRSFGRARALGRALARPDRSSFVLSAARDHDESVARAFAAELLAPAAGIKDMLGVIGRADSLAFDAIAGRYGVSPLLVRHQYDNQITSSWS